MNPHLYSPTYARHDVGSSKIYHSALISRGRLVYLKHTSDTADQALWWARRAHARLVTRYDAMVSKAAQHIRMS